MGPGAGKRTSGKTQRTAAHSPASAPTRGMPKQARPLVTGKPASRKPHIAETVAQTAASTTLHVDVKNVAVGQMARGQSQQVRAAGRAARRAANVGDSASQTVAASVDAKNFAMGQMSRGQRKEVTRAGRETRRAASATSPPKPNGRTQMMLSGDELTESRQVAAATKSRTIRKAAAKPVIAARDAMTGLRQLQGFGNKAMYGLAVATPAMFATSALVHGTMGWNRAKEAGGSNLQAAGAAAAGAAPASIALAAPTIIGRTAPQLAAIVSKAALPLTALAAGIGAGVGAYKAYQRGASAGGILGGAALGAADTFTGGLASTAWTKWAGSGQGDATTLAITNHAAAGARTASAQSGAAMAGSQPPKLTADAAKRFNAAEKTYRSAQEASGSERQPAEKPEASGRQPGFGPEAIIASYYKRNPGGTNAPYGGDPTQAEGYTAPTAPKDKKS